MSLGDYRCACLHGGGRAGVPGWQNLYIIPVAQLGIKGVESRTSRSFWLMLRFEYNSSIDMGGASVSSALVLVLPLLLVLQDPLFRAGGGGKTDSKRKGLDLCGSSAFSRPSRSDSALLMEMGEPMTSSSSSSSLSTGSEVWRPQSVKSETAQ